MTNMDEFIVGFSKRKRNRNLRKLLDKNFGTVFTCRKDGDLWLGLNVKSSRLEYKVIDQLYSDKLKKYGYTFIRCYVPTESDDKLRLGMTPIRCCAIAKLAIGVHKFSIWTPKQLHDYLLSDACRTEFGIEIVEYNKGF